MSLEVETDIGSSTAIIEGVRPKVIPTAITMKIIV